MEFMQQDKKYNEWQVERIVLPEDEPDEDDELDILIEKIEKKKKNRVVRGHFFGV